MIKFWKSAAKGKSGCPVRPPEESAVDDTGNRICLDTNITEYVNEGSSQIFEKKSKISISLHDILIEKTAIKYFMQFMESIGKPAILIKCWLELEAFKTIISSNKNTKIDDPDDHLKLHRAKSFDLYSNSLKRHHDRSEELYTSHRFSWTESSMFYSDSNIEHNKNEGSSSSCGNLTDHTNARQIHSKNDKYLIEEAVTLFKKYVALESSYQLDLPDDVRKCVITNICHPEGIINEDCFKPVQDILYTQIENTYYSDFQNSPYYIKAQIDILSNMTLTLQDILYNEMVLFYFTEYLEQESCSILLEFLMAVMHFRDNLINNQSSDLEQAQADAIILYEKYFSLQATSPIGFSTDVRLKAESNICREGGPLPTCFDLPYQIVFKTLTHYVTTFLESDLYYKYLSEMIHSVDHNWPSNRKSHSDCSSEFSISTQNTLLAMGDPYHKKKRNHSVPDMTIDSNQLYNADALWQRKRHDGLNLGRINSLGRFESKFEPDPDKKDKSVLKKMVNRFVPITKSQVEEEMAWQIAHMIVKDVTDLTMAPPYNDRDDV